ncbi:MAG: ABC transporter permease [Candidatus Nanoarchaeia archaeon]|jgi:ABC-2 type transport system permease protein
MVDIKAIYTLWLRELKRFSRSKSRIISSLSMPLLFLVALGLGFSNINVAGAPEGASYIAFLMPGIICMTLMTSSVMSGISVLWDREFGFLKEIMVAPVDRLSIALGRMAGGVTTSMIQGLLILLLSLLMGVGLPSIVTFLMVLLVMTLISTTFVGLGLIFSSIMKDMQGFSSIMSFIIMPLLFLSGAFYPIDNLPLIVRLLSYADPLTYGVDALRGLLIGFTTFPLIMSVGLIALTSIIMIVIGTALFNKSDNA